MDFNRLFEGDNAKRSQNVARVLKEPKETQFHEVLHEYVKYILEREFSKNLNNSQDKSEFQTECQNKIVNQNFNVQMVKL